MAAAPRRIHLNFVHNDEIWKDHIRHESMSQRQKWPERWGYLVQEYQMLNDSLAGKPCVKKPVNTGGSCVKLPPIQTSYKPRYGFPVTTSRQIGWLSSKPETQLEIYGRYGPHPRCRGQYGLLKHFKWPQESSP